MSAYENILLAFDDSQYSKAALVETLNWAKAHNSKVTLVHAVFFDSEEFAIKPSQLEERLAAGKAACEEMVSSLAPEFDMEIDYIIRQGEPHEVVPEEALKNGADLIAMGTYGRRGLRRAMMGSVTAGVILGAPCDVLVVKRKCEDCTGEYRNIVVSYDGSELSKKAVERVSQFADPDAKVTLLYVIPRYEEMVNFFRSESIQNRLQEEAEKVISEGCRIAAEHGVQAECLIEQGHPAEQIAEEATKLDADLIMIGSHGWRGVDKRMLGSTSERVISRSPVPVLVVR